MKLRYFFCSLIVAWTIFGEITATTIVDLVDNSPQEVLFQAHLRKVAELNLRNRSNPSIFVVYSHDSEEHKRRIQKTCEDLERAGIPATQILFDVWANRPGGPYDLHQFMERIPNSDKVLLFGSPGLKRKYEEREAHPEDAGIVSHEINLLRNRIVVRGVESLIPAWFEGQFEDSFPISLHHIVGRQLDNYSLRFFDLLWDIYQTIYPFFQNPIIEIRDKFSVRQSRLRTSSDRTEFHSVNGFFPQSLKAYNAFLDRTDDRGLSYLDVIFEELFMNEDDVKHFSTTTLCASGLGGVGKTTLATEFAHKYGSFYGLVYWMGGGSRDEFLRSCLSLLELLDVPIPERDDYSNVIRLVNENLSMKRQHWLLIIDNVEDPTLIAELSPSNGHILYTSRHSDWVRKIDVDVLRREESVALLLQLTGLDPSFTDQAGVLAEELGDLPLAIAQAAAYIKQQGLSFEAYLDIYRVRYADLLARQQIQPSLNKREAVVMTTWNTTMEALPQEAQQLMSYCSYLAPTAISVQLFGGIEAIQSILGELAQYSMIKFEKDAISLHRLVQTVGRIKQENREEVALKQLFQNLLSLWIRFWNEDVKNRGSYRSSENYQDIFNLHNVLYNWAPHCLSLKEHIERLSSTNILPQTDGENFKIYINALQMLLIRLEKNTFSCLANDRFVSTESKEANLIGIIRQKLLSDQRRGFANEQVFLKKLVKMKDSNGVIDALDKIKSNNALFESVINNALQISENMDGQQCSRIISELSKLNLDEVSELTLLAQRLIMRIEKMINVHYVIKMLVHFKKEVREEIVDQMLEILPERIFRDGEYLSQVIKKMQKIKREDRASVASHAERLRSLLLDKKIEINRQNVRDDYLFSMDQIAPVPVERREDFIAKAQENLVDGMGWFPASALLKMVAKEEMKLVGLFKDMFFGEFAVSGSVAVPSNEIAFRPPCAMASLLINTEMPQDERDAIDKALSSFKEEQETVVQQVCQLITENMSGFERADILNAFSEIEESRRSEIYNYTRQFSHNGMSGEEIACIIDALSKIEEDISDIVSMTQRLAPENANGYLYSKIIEGLLKASPESRENIVSNCRELIINSPIRSFNFPDHIDEEECEGLIRSMAGLTDREQLKNLIHLAQDVIVDLQKTKYMFPGVIRELRAVKATHRIDVASKTKNVIKGRNVDRYECPRVIEALSKLEKDKRDLTVEKISEITSLSEREDVSIYVFIKNISCDELIRVVSSTI
jgi:hypothetical protein